LEWGRDGLVDSSRIIRSTDPEKQKKSLTYIFLILFSIFLSLFATLLNSTSRVLSTGCIFNIKYTQPNKNMFLLCEYEKSQSFEENIYLPRI
jgi:hypothetical protein